MYNNNDIKITNKRKAFYLPKVEFWILDDLKLDVRKGMLYKIILQKEFMVWNSEYLGVILRCSGRTILRDVDLLCERGLVSKAIKTYGGKPRWVLVANYTERGLRSPEEIKELFKQGFQKLDTFYDM